jgi:hypothetical protein
MNIDITNKLAIAVRGSCTFAMKVANAELAGYKALLIVNHDDSLFVYGGEPSSTKSSIPSFLITPSAIENITKIANNQLDKLYFSLVYNKAKPDVFQFNDINLPKYMLTLVLLLLVGIISYLFYEYPTQNTNSFSTRTYTIFIIVLMFHFSLRLGTYRISNSYGVNDDIFNHKETDEIIYKVCGNVVL